MSHMEKMSQFASQADSFINAALDQLDDAVEQAVMDQGGDADAIAKHALSASKLSEVRAAVSFWSDLDVDARREEWRDAAMQMTSSKESGAAVKRALGDAARAAHAPDATEAHQKALVKAMAAEVKALTSRVDFAETAFMSMLNDLDEAPDPAPALAAAAAAYVSSAADAAATSARRLETARAKLAAAEDSAAANASAAAELAALRAAFDDKVEAAARERLADADARATSAEAAAETALRAAARAESEAADARRDLDAAQSRVFDLEEARTADTARASEAEAEAAASEAEGARRREAAALGECQRLRREVRRLRERLGGALGAEPRGDESRSQSENLDDAALALGGGVDAASLRERLAVQKSVVAQLKEALEDAESAAERDAAAFREAAESHARETERLRDELAAAAAAAASRPPPEAIASMETRIRTLLALVDAEDGDALDAAAAAAANGDAEGAPLVAARGRNRRLAADLAEARREAAEARLAAERAEARAATAERRGAAKDAAVAELEKHLAAATDAKTEDANKTSAKTDADDAAGVVGALFGAAGFAAGFAAESEKTPPAGSASAASAASASSSAASDAALLPVVAGQRDRHARRAADLETRVGEVESELENERAAAAKLRADNIGLFEKVKYLQTFYAERGASGPGTRVVRVDADGVPAPGANARYGCGFGGVSVAVDGAGPLGALARRRAAKFGLWGRGRGERERDPASFDDVPGGDAEGLLGRYAEASAAARATSESRGARERPKGRMVRAFFVVYFALVHAFLARVLVSSATARSRA